MINTRYHIKAGSIAVKRSGFKIRDLLKSIKIPKDQVAPLFTGGSR